MRNRICPGHKSCFALRVNYQVKGPRKCLRITNFRHKSLDPNTIRVFFPRFLFVHGGLTNNSPTFVEHNIWYINKPFRILYCSHFHFKYIWTPTDNISANNERNFAQKHWHETWLINNFLPPHRPPLRTFNSIVFNFFGIEPLNTG